MTIEIESGIPVPRPGSGRKRSDAASAAFRMARGDSVLCKTLAEREIVRQTINKNGGRYASRKVDEGWRVWRIA